MELFDPDENLVDTKDCLSDSTGKKFIRLNNQTKVQRFTGEYQLFSITTGMK